MNNEEHIMKIITITTIIIKMIIIIKIIKMTIIILNLKH